MSRPRTHDERAARQGAVEAFLRGGYEGTSLALLETATGLNRRQLYNQYGDKRGIFLQALADFQQAAAGRFLEGLESSAAGLGAIRATLEALVAAAESPRGRLGCLICNTSHEPIAGDAGVKRAVQAYFGRIEGAYAAALERARARGEIALGPLRLRRAARQLLSTHVALCVMARAGCQLEVLADVASGALDSLT